MGVIAVLALDGLDPDVVARLRADGGLPHLSALAATGVSGRLRSTWPPVSVPAWSSFLTGVGPGRHGLFDFTRRVGGRIAFQNGADRAVPTLLELADRAGRRVCSIGIPTTYPAPRLRHGAALSGFDSPFSGRPDPLATHPLELWRRLRKEGLDLRISTLPEGRKGRRWHDRAERAIHASIERRTAQARRLLVCGPWDLLVVHFQAADTAGHHFTRYFDAASERHDAAHPDRARVVPGVYDALDRAVGVLRDALPRDALLIVLSDHGMGPASACVVYLNRWLEEQGYLVRRRGAVQRLSGAAVDAARHSALRYLPRELQSRLFRRLRRGAGAALESASRLGHIDLERSRAFSEESATLPGIWLLDPRAGEELRRRLRAWEAVVRIHRREDRYWGPLRERAPDLLLELRHTPVRTPTGYAGPSLRRLSPAELDGERGAALNGAHRPEGVLYAAGAGLGPAAIHGAWIGDLAPTLLARLGVPIPAWIEGRPLAELGGSPEWTETPPAPLAAVTRPPLTPRERRRVERRLRALGYLG